MRKTCNEAHIKRTKVFAIVAGCRVAHHSSSFKVPVMNEVDVRRRERSPSILVSRVKAVCDRCTFWSCIENGGFIGSPLKMFFVSAMKEI